MFQMMDKYGHVNIGINIECSFEMEMFGFDSMAVIYCMTIKATAPVVSQHVTVILFIISTYTELHN
jgi:hypothetical protein